MSVSLSLDSNEQPAVYTIITSDGDKFTLTHDEIQLSVLLKETFESNNSSKEEDHEIRLDTISSSIFKHVESFLKHFSGETKWKEIERPLKSKVMREVTDEWSADFIDNISENRDTLYKVITAANFLNIQPLLFLACAKVAGLIKGIPIDQIKATLLDKNVTLSA